MSTITLSERVAVSFADHVATVTLSRPEKHNALDQAMFEGISAAAAEIAGTPGVRAVVLHGAGPSFCSGIDLMSLVSADAGIDAIREPLRGPVPNQFQNVAHAWVTLPVPVIAAVHGNCLGGGLQIALGADIRLASADTKLSVMEVKWGLVPDMALTRTLPRLVGIDVAKELTFTGRVVRAEEAAALGLVTRVCEDPLGDAQALAAEIATKSPDAVRSAKRLINESWTAGAQESLRMEADLQAELIGSPNQLAAVQAGFTREPAQFADPA